MPRPILDYNTFIVDCLYRTVSELFVLRRPLLLYLELIRLTSNFLFLFRSDVYIFINKVSVAEFLECSLLVQLCYKIFSLILPFYVAT